MPFLMMPSVPTDFGLIQAATVILPVMSSDASSGALAYWLVPFRLMALPTLPVTKVGPATVAALLAGAAPESTAVEAVPVSSIFHQPTRLGSVPPDVMVTLTVAMFESTVPSLALKVKLSEPVWPASGVYV